MDTCLRRYDDDEETSDYESDIHWMPDYEDISGNQAILTLSPSQTSFK